MNRLAINFLFLLFILSPLGCQKPVAEDETSVIAEPERLTNTTAKAAVRIADTATDRPIQAPHDGYVTSQVCLDCHESEHQSWHDSYHRTMTQIVTPDSVLGGFDGETKEHYGWLFRPERRGDEFWMHFQSKSSGKQFEHKLVLSTGSHHMQKFWYHTGSSRKLGLAPLIFLRESQRWVPEHTAFLRPTKPALPVREGTWNKGCNQCHATGSQPRINGPDEMDTLVAEFGISCEACHGPGEQHVLEMQTEKRTALLDAEATASSIVNPRKLTAERSSQVCGQCHGAWLTRQGANADYQQTGNEFRPGADLMATRFYPHRENDVELHGRMHAEKSFWPDGQVRVAGREFNALIASPCFKHADESKRMSCVSCHDMHNETGIDKEIWADDQLSRVASGNDACLQCHESFKSNLTSHTHHAADSAGSLCYNCHMPHTSYGLLKAVRAHKITSPSLHSTLETGRPNACNQCHLDQTLAWTGQKLTEWYGHAGATLSDEQQKIAASVLWATKGDAAQRALMAWSMGWSEAHAATDPHWMVFYLTNLMFDDYDAIRYIAHRSLKRIQGFADLKFDHLRPQQERERVMDEVMGRWMNSGKPRPSDPKLLYTADGQLRFDIFRQLFQQQDKTEIVITE